MRRLGHVPECGVSLNPGDVDLRAVWAAAKSARRSRELSGGGLRPRPDPRPAVPLPIPGLSNASNSGAVGVKSGLLALARVGRAGSFLAGLARLRAGCPGASGPACFSESSAIAAIWAERRDEGRAAISLPTVSPRKTSALTGNSGLLGIFREITPQRTAGARRPIMPRSSHRPAAHRPPDGPGALALHRAALDAMAHGLCVFDAEWRIALFNRRYLEIFNLSPEVIQPGLSYREMLAHSCERGNLAPDAVEAFWRERRKLLQGGAPFTSCRALPSGIIVSMRYEPLPDGGWVSVYEEVTAQHRLESRSEERRVGKECR